VNTLIDMSIEARWIHHTKSSITSLPSQVILQQETADE